MRLYVDNQYSPAFIKLVAALHALDFTHKYDIVTGQWQDEFTPSDTVVFLWDTSKKGLSQQIVRHYQDGYKVFTYKKPFGKPMNLFRISLVMLSQWRKMLETIEKENGAFLFIISDSKKNLRRVV